MLQLSCVASLKTEVQYNQSKGTMLHVQAVEIGVSYLKEGALYLFLTH